MPSSWAQYEQRAQSFLFAAIYLPSKGTHLLGEDESFSANNLSCKGTVKFSNHLSTVPLCLSYTT